MFDKFPTTVIPVLCGVVAGETATRNSVVPPGITVFGFAAPVAESVGLPPEQAFVGLLVLRGVGSVIEKSALLSSVSLQPPPLRPPAVLALKSAVFVFSKQFADPP